jgi:hypothetical protein
VDGQGRVLFKRVAPEPGVLPDFEVIKKAPVAVLLRPWRQRTHADFRAPI